MIDIVLVSLVILVPLLLVVLTFLLNNNTADSAEILLPFECGLGSNESIQLPFSFQFFMVSIMFIIFDMEICLLLPVVVGGVRGVLVIVLLLLWCTLLETKMGSTNWT